MTGVSEGKRIVRANALVREVLEKYTMTGAVLAGLFGQLGCTSIISHRSKTGFIYGYLQV